MKIKYRGGYKYQLYETYTVEIRVFPDKEITTEFIGLTTNGILTVRRGYAWDGPSGPTIDTPNFMRGSLIHDALYQLLRERHLGGSWRDDADQELRRVCTEDGMSWVRTIWVYWAVRWAGGPFADPAYDRPVLEAP